jgi:hypothetical protein
VLLVVDECDSFKFSLIPLSEVTACIIKHAVKTLIRHRPAMYYKKRPRKPRPIFGGDEWASLRNLATTCWLIQTFDESGLN